MKFSCCAFPTIVLLLAGVVAAEEPAGQSKLSPPATTELEKLITTLVRNEIPHTFVDRREWEKTAERWDGLHVHREGLKIVTKRRKKIVNHGTWKAYEAHLVNPDEEFKVELRELRDLGERGVAVELWFTAHTHVLGRLAQWVKGVQIIGLTAEADAWVQLRLQCELKMALDVGGFPPDVTFQPHVNDAQLLLLDFRLIRISQVGGDLAEEFGRGVRKVLEDKIADEQPKIAAKLNQQIEKHQDKLRLSLSDLLSSKFGALGDFLE